MNRSLKLSILVALTLSSTQALALGLGQIRVKSALNKPLVAEIPLRTDYPGEADKMQVSLASNDQFARAGLDRMSLTVQLKFKVTTNAAGQKVILVTSDQPVRESFLDFLVKVTWPRGQLLREYTVLLDPPEAVATTRLQGAVAPSAPAPAPRKPVPKPVPPAAPAPKPAAPRAASAPPAHKPAPAPAPAPAPSAPQGGQYGPVHAGQTLWGIATKMRDANVSVNQMMLALQSANPDAFYKNNINALKRGAVLRIPTRAQQQAMTAAAAVAEVRRQNRDWSAAAPGHPTMIGSAGGANTTASRRSNAARGSAAAGAGGDQLKLVPPSQGGESTGARAGSAKGSDQVTVAQLHQDIARTKEALSSAKQQTADLQTRLKSLKDIQDKNDRLMSLKNAEIAELQNKLAAAGQPVPGASSAMPAMSGSVAGAAKASTAMTPVAAASVAASSSAMKTSAASKPVPAKKAAAKPAPARAVAQPWYASLLGSLWAKVAAAIVVVLALLMLLRSRRGKKVESVAGSSSLADQFGDSPLGDAPADDFDEEQDALLRELAESPDDIGLHLELVSLYYARRDVEHFEAAAEAMYTHVSDPQQPEWQDVVTMGEELSPDYPLFAGGAEAYAPVVPDDAPSQQDEAPQDAAAAEEPISEYSYDFDLTPEAAEAPKPEPEAPSEDEYDALPPLPGEETPAPVADLGDEIEGFELPEIEPEQEADVSPVTEPDMTLDLESVPGLEPEPESEPERESEPMMESFDLDIDEEESDAPAPGLGGDAVDTKIDLARAYMDMGDPDGARAMLEEVLAEGSGPQRDVAQKLLDELD
ncbi:FimV/HubP family polar landmark protein [Oleiagrimonas sp. MCCC 1A03011]|uniref:FimV/HubP family polar landmark protein n=1 Tax=Oleiagrimonas sp. MCCC 1A03011 TaxID=1926883 RepID=UPI000DC2AD1B|nr:FimV/HubP family polar landmark protein [Oleiagrimonas sp. MCCC 1A03011]RAP59178.1 hypothetical protein BTJ49_00345 [Oleiagrimonas sp. MCCC 1A03011]